jgi:hypothetical protein
VSIIIFISMSSISEYDWSDLGCRKPDERAITRVLENFLDEAIMRDHRTLKESLSFTVERENCGR